MFTSKQVSKSFQAYRIIKADDISWFLLFGRLLPFYFLLFTFLLIIAFFIFAKVSMITDGSARFV